MKTVVETCSKEIDIKGSKFISYIYSVNSIEKAKDILQHISSQHARATHVCYAYVLYNGESKFSDDGEPTYTAGKPIQESIEKNGLTNVLIATVRYFGGTKLGAGGLVRAYTKSASEVISVAKLKQLNVYNVYNVSVSYDILKSVQHNLNNINAVVKDMQYKDCVDMLVYVVTDTEDDFINICNKYNIDKQLKEKNYLM